MALTLRAQTGFRAPGRSLAQPQAFGEGTSTCKICHSASRVKHTSEASQASSPCLVTPACPLLCWGHTDGLTAPGAHRTPSPPASSCPHHCLCLGLGLARCAVAGTKGRAALRAHNCTQRTCGAAVVQIGRNLLPTNDGATEPRCCQTLPAPAPLLQSFPALPQGFASG